MNELYGVDISSNNPQVKLTEVATAKQFVIIKSSGDEDVNNDYVNEFFAGWAVQAAELGMERAFYHYCRPQFQNPEASADHFVNTIIAHLRDGDNLAADAEEGTGNQENWYAAWNARVAERLLDYDIVANVIYLYSNQDFLTTRGLRTQRIKALYRLWLAAWNQPAPVPVSPWDDVPLWQNDAYDKTVPGFGGQNALTDTFFGTRGQWRANGIKKKGANTHPYWDKYWHPIQALVDDMIKTGAYPHSDAALHATISNAITQQKIALGVEQP